MSTGSQTETLIESASAALIVCLFMVSPQSRPTIELVTILTGHALLYDLFPVLIYGIGSNLHCSLHPYSGLSGISN